MAIRAVGFTAVILPEEVKKTTESGLVLAIDEVMERNAQVLGTVVELGEDFAVAYRPTTPKWGLKAGDKVFFARYAGKWVKDPEDGKEFLIILDTDVVGKYEPNVVATQKT
jgi:co-chaperonin GroES (HSP10)